MSQTPNIIPEFQDHIEKLKIAKHQADQTLEVMIPGYTTAETIISLAWEQLFETFKDNPSTEVADHNAFAGVVQKLVGSLGNMKALEIKLRELSMKEAAFDQKKKEWQAAIQNKKNSESGLTLEALEQIEKEINFL